MTPHPAPLPRLSHVTLYHQLDSCPENSAAPTCLLLIDIQDLLGLKLPIPTLDAIMQCLLATPKLLTFRPLRSNPHDH
jgi:hypothetical protein